MRVFPRRYRQQVLLRGCGCRVSDVLETLATVAHIPASDQILLCEGTRLEASRTLSFYGLPDHTGSRAKDVYLYDKSQLRSQGVNNMSEPAKPLASQGPSLEHLLLQQATEISRGSSFEALLGFEHHFKLHLQVAHARLQTSKQRFQDCSELLSEMEVQNRAIEMARNNVETHYMHTHHHVAAFMQQYTNQHRRQADLLAAFPRDLQDLQSLELHPALQKQGQASLLALMDVPHLTAWAERCTLCHSNLFTKVGCLEKLFADLKVDVEAVFMQGPSIQLEALATQLQAMQSHLQELESIAEVLGRDSDQIQNSVSSARQELGAGSSGTRRMSLSDTCQLMETMHENHTGYLLPQAQHIDAMFARFYERCLHDKSQMMRDVAYQLKRISSQQLGIQGIRNKLAGFSVAAAKMEEMAAELMVVQKVQLAYHQCLAECLRRQAFGDLYAGQAHQMAERMGKLREKECSMRESFLSSVQEHLPASILGGLGLLHMPPHCQITLPAQPEIAQITPEILQRAPKLAGKLVPLQSSRESLHANALRHSQHAAQPGDGSDAVSAGQALEVENSRLRAELAMRAAEGCLKSLTESSASQGSQQLEEAVGRQPADAETKVLGEAVAAQQELVRQLNCCLADSKMQAANYALRIQALEARLSQQAASAGFQAEASEERSKSPAVLGREPTPLALTPVQTSPTRSLSPAAVPASEPSYSPQAQGSRDQEGPSSSAQKPSVRSGQHDNTVLCGHSEGSRVSHSATDSAAHKQQQLGALKESSSTREGDALGHLNQGGFKLYSPSQAAMGARGGGIIAVAFHERNGKVEVRLNVLNSDE